MTTLMRPYLELEAQVATALGWTGVAYGGDMDFGNWSTAWHNQTLLRGCPPEYKDTHRPDFPAPRYIIDGEANTLLHQMHLNISWDPHCVMIGDSWDRVGERCVEPYASHPSQKIALYTAICKMVLLIKNVEAKAA